MNLLLQTAEQDAYDFFTSAIDGDVLDHLPLPRRSLNTTNETRGQGVPPAAARVELTAEREEERDEADTSTLLEQQVSPQSIIIIIIINIRNLLKITRRVVQTRGVKGKRRRRKRVEVGRRTLSLVNHMPTMRQLHS